MPARTLDHVNIATDRVIDTSNFFCDVLGLKATTPMPDTRPEDAQWLLDEKGHPVIHLARPDLIRSAGHPVSTGHGSGSIHHVAFVCDGHDAMLAKLEGEGRVERTYAIPAISLRQIFTRDPNGILVELNFTGD